MEEPNGVLNDADFLFKVGIGAHASVGNAEELVIAGNFKQHDVAHE